MALETRNYIAGEWLDGADRIENRNPSDLSDLIGHFAQADAAQLDAALVAARAAQAGWGATGPQRRHDVLMAIGTELMARAADIGALIAREEGKPLAEGRGEAFRAGQFFTYFAAEALRQLGQTADSVRDGIEIDVRREPVGVVAIISPWNFPVATPAWKIAPALAFGNAVIWKPANQTPASAVALAQIIARQDLPAGVFNLVMGAGSRIGQALAESAGLDVQVVARLLDSGADVEEIRARDADIRARGLRGVPAFVIVGQHVVAGAQEVPFWLRIIDELAEHP